MRISMKEIWCNMDGLPKNKQLLSYIVKFEFSRPKSSSVILNSAFILSKTDFNK